MAVLARPLGPGVRVGKARPPRSARGSGPWGLSEICSLPQSANPRSFAVCERLGMQLRPPRRLPPPPRGAGRSRCGCTRCRPDWSDTTRPSTLTRMLVVLLGGARSGEVGVRRVAGAPASRARFTYIATAHRTSLATTTLDARIARHRADRPEPLGDDRGRARPRRRTDVPLATRSRSSTASPPGRATSSTTAAPRSRRSSPRTPRSPSPQARAATTVVVTNEVGMGIVPADALSPRVPRPARPDQPALGGSRRPRDAARRRAGDPPPPPRRADAMTWFHDAPRPPPRAPTPRRRLRVRARADDILRPAGALAQARRARRVRRRLAGAATRLASSGRRGSSSPPTMASQPRAA